VEGLESQMIAFNELAAESLKMSCRRADSDICGIGSNKGGGGAGLSNVKMHIIFY